MAMLRQVGNKEHRRLRPYFADVEYDAEEGSFTFVNEELNLKDEMDLLNRIEKQRNGMWSCYINLGVAGAQVYPSIFTNNKDKQTTLILTTGYQITRFLWTEEPMQKSFVFFLIRTAAAIGADWFLSGLYFNWNPLSIAQPEKWQTADTSVLMLGWKSGCNDEQDIMTKFDLKNEDIQRTTLSYRYILVISRVKDFPIKEDMPRFQAERTFV